MSRKYESLNRLINDYGSLHDNEDASHSKSVYLPRQTDENSDTGRLKKLSGMEDSYGNENRWELQLLWNGL